MSYKIYPVVPTEPRCDDYAVAVNGSHVPLNTARVSAFPHNRRWPGHQRSIDQSETVQFASLSADGPIDFEITPREPFSGVKIRPQSLGIVPTVENGTIRFTLPHPAYFTVEPYGRSRALHVFVDPPKDYGICETTPGVRYFGPGEHDVGLIEMKSNETLYLDEGAVVYASIHAIDAENIRILGRGILDNSKNIEEVLFDASVENNSEAVCNVKRRHTVQLEYCTGVEIDGITIRDSLVYNIRPIGCNDLSIRNVKIIGCWRYNSDGIDMHNCRGVRIFDCFVRTFDDSICVKGFDCYHSGDVGAAVRAAMYRGGKSYDVFEDVLVARCVVWNDWGKSLEIGAETKAEEIRNITFRDVDIIHLTGAALDCTNVDYADVHGITFRNINIECDEAIPEPKIQKTDAEEYKSPDAQYMPPTISIQTLYHHEYSRGSDAARRGRNRDFLFENIRVLGDKLPRILCSGYDESHKTEHIRIRGLTLNGEPVRELPPNRLRIGQFTEDISVQFDPYAELAKNSVDAHGQLRGDEVAADREGSGVRILFVGNSITLHGIREEVGWYNVWGMAASAEERDYVHILERRVLAEDSAAAFRICQVAEWERQYREGGSRLYPKYAAAREFSADIIVVRCIENCDFRNFDEELFLRELDALIGYLDAGRGAALVVTTSFWPHVGDSALRRYAKEHGITAVELGDLGSDDSMKAIGLFEHRGVANHPGDLGMQAIADRIAEQLLPLVRGKCFRQH